MLGTTRADEGSGCTCCTGGAEELAPNPISVDRIVVMVPDLERLWEGSFRVRDSLRVHNFEIFDCYGWMPGLH